MQLRYYQKDCLAAMYDWLYTRTDNPVSVLATGAGKSIIIAQFIKTMIQQYPNTRILCCIDTKELIQQNYEKLLEIWQFAPAGVCSAGLKRKDTKHQILFTGIQSVYNKAHLIGHTDILIVDEVHMLSNKAGTTWQRFLNDLRPTRIIGLTATPYRNDCGLIYTGEDAVFGGVCYEYSVKQGIKDGYLSEVIPKTMTTHFDMDGVRTQNGDFAEGEMQERVNIAEKNEAVIDEIEKYGRDRKGWLIFSAGCDHANELHKILQARGYNGAVVLGDTPNNQRDEYISQFKKGELRYLVNNAVLTKGFDAPHIDLLAAVRPTQSPVLWAQMIGRALRKAEGKENALLLDFAENVYRFGFIDEMEFTDKKKKGDKEGVPVVKTCPNCDSIVAAGVRLCPYCAHEFPPPEPEIKREAYGGAVLSTQVVPEWKNVEVMYVSLHKSAKPIPTLKIEYVCDNFERYFEYICLEHEAGSFPRNNAIKWWKANTDIHRIKNEETCLWLIKEHGVTNIPKTIKDAVRMKEAIKQPSRIRVIQDGKFWRVLERDNSQPPVLSKPEPANNDVYSLEELL